MRQLDLFGYVKPRAQRRVLMQCTNMGSAPDGSDISFFECRRCPHEGWYIANLTQSRRGIPCPSCNAAESGK